jgi:hypothetical protein
VGNLSVAYSSSAPATGAAIQAASGATSAQTVLTQAQPGWANDSSTDAKQIGSDRPPDLTSVGATISHGVVTLHARFISGSYDANTVTVFSIDTDRNPRTGWQGNYPDSSDPGLMGTETVVATGGCYGTKAAVYRYSSDRNLMQLGNSYSVVNSVTNGFDIALPASSIGSANFAFRAETWREASPCAYAGSSDAAPDLSALPARPAEADGPLAAPDISSSSDQIQSGSPASLSWNPVAGAQFYLVTVDQSQGSGFASDQNGLFWLLSETSDTTQRITFDGQAPARWRVWAVDSNGQAGAPSAWH